MESCKVCQGALPTPEYRRGRPRVYCSKHCARNVNKEKMRRYYAENKQNPEFLAKKRDEQRRWRLENKERATELRQNWENKNREFLKNYRKHHSRKYYAANQEHMQQQARERRAKLKLNNPEILKLRDKLKYELERTRPGFKDKCKVQRFLYRQNNLDKIAVKDRAWRTQPHVLERRRAVDRQRTRERHAAYKFFKDMGWIQPFGIPPGKLQQSYQTKVLNAAYSLAKSHEIDLTPWIDYRKLVKPSKPEREAILRNCVFCDREFTVRHKNQNKCSNECRKMYASAQAWFRYYTSDENRTRNREYARAHPEIGKRWRENNREKIREYRWKNKERIKARTRLRGRLASAAFRTFRDAGFMDPVEKRGKSEKEYQRAKEQARRVALKLACELGLINRSDLSWNLT